MRTRSFSNVDESLAETELVSHCLHCQHEMYEMWSTDVARSVVCVFVCLCVLVTWVSCAKATEPIKIPFGGGGLTHVGSRNHVLDQVKIDQDWINRFTTDVDAAFYGRLFNRVGLIQPVSNVRPSVRTFVRPSVRPQDVSLISMKFGV